MTRSYRFALLGENIDYSLSPEIFSVMFRETGLSGSMDLVSVSPDQLAPRLKEMAADGLTGFAVTIPHKVDIVGLLDRVSPEVERIGAVNSISVRDGLLVGDNTDGHGFLCGLKRSGTDTPLDSALVLGSGGAAQAVIDALGRLPVMSQIGLHARTTGSVNALRQHFKDTSYSTLLQTYSADIGVSRPYQIVVNCTPAGGAKCPADDPLPPRFDWSGVKLYYDLNYNRDNRLLELARRSGVTAIDGSMMLVTQAAKSFENWTGQKIAIEPVYQAVFGAGGQQR